MTAKTNLTYDMVVGDIIYVYQGVPQLTSSVCSNKANLTYIPGIPLEDFNENR